ncbi:MAG: cytochrome c maturation protein CcmE [Kofleriaceae bacterium]|nr:MAG: cytochrome c maturation protein CcmE [Kofleriaceae bacterium]MBZ0235669.1 cytochrome c maturation protein CcmE [Kofleriaceae bacterium]
MRLEPVRITPGLVLAVLAGVGLAAAMRTPAPEPAPHQVGGTIARGSLVSTAGEHRFVLVAPWGDLPRADLRELEVRYRGVLPDTVCEGNEVLARGRVAADHVRARELLGRSPSKYDACWHPCRREPPPACRDRDPFP